MNDNDDDIIVKVRHWVELADEDLRVAKFTLKMKSNVPYRIIAFHSQQSAEKYIKALLVFHKIDFPYTHNIEKLLELTPKEYNLVSKLLTAGDLTDYAVAKRYPDFYQKLTKKTALETIVLAEKVRKTINSIFRKLDIHLHN